MMRCIRLGRLASLGVACAVLAACRGGGEDHQPVTATSTAVPPTAAATLTPTATPLRPSPAPLGTATATLVTRERDLVLDARVEGEYVPGAAREVYTFTSDRARRVGLQLIPADDVGPLQLRARMLDADTNTIPQQIMPDGDSALVGAWDLPGAGTYTLVLFGPETQPRRFLLALVPLMKPEPGGGEIAYGETRSGDIATPGQQDTWTFTGQAGDRVQVKMLSLYADSVLSLYGPDGELLAMSDGGDQAGQSPVLALTLHVSGTYSLVARLYGDTQTGTYQLTLQRVALELQD